jgi:hypothetical protein
MTRVMPLEPDRGEIYRFVEALLPYATDGTHVSLRAFSGDEPWRTDLWRRVQIGADRTPLIDAAARLAEQCANAAEVVVFCPPVATFRGSRATEDNLADGLVLSVECDAHPAEARAKLEGMLGPATVVVASGDEWNDHETGEIQDKLHLHWRLAVPARTTEEHKNLKLARRLATMLVGADATGVPPVHPLRWPGSWHRKGKPRLARIVGGDPRRETVLSEALMILRDELGDIDETPHRNGEPQAPIEQLETAMLMLPNAERPWDEWNRYGLAFYAASGGSEEGYELFRRWSAKADKYSEAVTRGRWQHYHRSPPNRIGAGTLFYAAAVEWVEPTDEEMDDWVEPTDDEMVEGLAVSKPNGDARSIDIIDSGADWEAKPLDTDIANVDASHNGAGARSTDIAVGIADAEPGWPVLGPAAYQGLAGEIVRAIEPHSEADPSALLIQLITAYGNTIGRTRYCRIEATRHHCNLFTTLVGQHRPGARARRWTTYSDYMGT